MAQRGLSMSLALVLVAAMWTSSSAQQPTCSPPAIVSLQPCLAFLTNNSSSVPSPQCCTQLASLVQSQAQCLCTFLNAAPPLPFNINRTQAITLPGACKIQAPPLSQCSAQSGPVIPGIPSGPVVPGIPSGPSVPAAGSPQAAPAPAAPVTPAAAAAPAPTSPAMPAAPAGGVSPPSNVPSTPAAQGVPPANDGSKAGPNKGTPSTSAASLNMITPSLPIFALAAASVLIGF